MDSDQAGDPKEAGFLSEILRPLKTGARYDRVIIHPLVLLNAVDHYGRSESIRSNSDDRTVGVLLGSAKGRILDITNSFAVPFSEDGIDIWYLNDDYLETMYGMFWKINAKEKIVGWYHTGPNLRPKDVEICDFFKKYIADPVLVIIRAQAVHLVPDVYSGMPTKAYILTENISSDSGSRESTFEHLACEIEAEEAEEVGVEHLLRGIRNVTAGSLSQQVVKQIGSSEGLAECLQQMRAYLEKLSDALINGTYNATIMTHLQDVVNPLSLHFEDCRSFSRHFLHALNDQMAVMYIAALCRAIVSLHDLINNRLSNRNAERAANEKVEAAARLTKKEGENTEKGRLV